MIHPLAQPTHARVDICIEGAPSEVLKDSIKLVRHAVRFLSAGENVLYLNACAPHQQTEKINDAISARHAVKILTYHETGGALMQKLEFLTALIEERKVRVIVLNSLDFAASNSNQRMTLVHWLRKMKDMHGVRVVIYMIHAPQQMGAMGQLAWMAESIERTGDWRAYQNSDNNFSLPTLNDTLNETLDEVRSEYTTSQIHATQSLNYKELGVLEEEEQEELEEEIEFA